MPSNNQPLAAAVTMVRDDAFFLECWLRYYGDRLGRENLYVINHGGGNDVRTRAAGCNVIAIPDSHHRNFDTKRWRLLNGISNGLRGYYRFVIVGDVDEIVCVDPATGADLSDYLAGLRGKRLLTPLGLEVLHRPRVERNTLDQGVLRARRHVRINPRYAKPCVVGRPARLSRGGHFSTLDTLEMPDDLYLLHLRYCDREMHAETLDRRNALVARTGAEKPAQAMIGKHWFSAHRNEAQIFDAFDAAEIAPTFDPSMARDALRRSWCRRPDTPFWHMPAKIPETLQVLPERFADLV